MSHSPEKRSRILRAASTLFATHPAEAVTMAQVARDADVAKGTIYLYFPSKDELFAALLLDGAQTVHAAIEAAAPAGGDPAGRGPDPWGRLRRGLEAAFSVQAGNPEAFQLRRSTELLSFAPDAFRREVIATRTDLLNLVTEAAGAGRAEARGDHVLGAVDAAVRRTIARTAALGAEADRLWRFVVHALEAPPLAGRSVLVTREEPEDGPLGAALRSRGANVRHVPLLETRLPENPEPMQRAAARLETYDWVILTSARAARALRGAGVNGARPFRLAVVGTATAEAARKHGWEPAIVGHGGAQQLLDSARDAGHSFEGKSVLFAAADRARPEAVRGLEAGGARVDVVTAYCTLPREDAGAALAVALADGPLDAVTLASPSAAETLLALTAKPSGSKSNARRSAAHWPVVASLGETTAEAARGIPGDRHVTAQRPGFDALADAVAQAFHPEGS